MKKILFSLTLLAFVNQGFAQGAAQNKSKFVRTLQKVVWTAGLHGVVIDDDGKPFKDLFNAGDSWSFVPFPSRLTLEGYIDKGVSIEGGFTYSKLKKGKTVGADDKKRVADATLLSFDVCAKYDLNELIGDTKWFSPYAIGGLGYTYRNVPGTKSAVTANLGLGFTVWFYKGFGFNAQSMAKFALPMSSSNYLMHSVGVVYRFNLLTGYKTPGRLGHRYNLFRNQ